MPAPSRPQPMATPGPLPRAVDLLADLEGGAISAVALLEQTYQRIAEQNPGVNAICTLKPMEQVLPEAEAVDAARAQGQPLPPLAGLPMAIKDLANVHGLATTMGSPILAQHMPEEDALFVSRLKAAGALIIGKTNTPEFGAGSNTFNPLFGSTKNPWDLSKVAGGSSGGAAAALAAGMVALADGSDMGGSLRNPAAYCNVVGLRPTLGRVPSPPLHAETFTRMSVEGPMARTVEDCALLLQAMAGPDKRDALSLSVTPLAAGEPLVRDIRDLRLAWAPRPAGLPVERPVASVLGGAVQRLWQLCPNIEEITLNELTGSMAVFGTLRAAAFAQLLGELYASDGDAMKATLRGNIELGLALSRLDIDNAEEQRARMLAALASLFERFDYLLLPVTQVMPFEANIEYPRQVDGQAMSSYIEWMASCCIMSPFGVPCLSVPAGFSPEGLPVGLQIVGRPGDDWGVLQVAYAFQEHTGHWRRSPPTVKAMS